MCIRDRGGGFYEGALLTTVLVLVAESFLSRLEYRILDHVPEINLYMEYTGKPCLEEVLRFLRENKDVYKRQPQTRQYLPGLRFVFLLYASGL